MAWVKSMPGRRGPHGEADVEKGLAGKGVRISDESGRHSAAGGGGPEGADARAAALQAKRDRYKSMTTTALEAARQQAQAERDAAAQGYDAAERAEREYLARKRAKAAHRDWVETQEQWREGVVLVCAAWAGFWRTVVNIRHLLAWRAQERRQSADIAGAQRADVERRKTEEKRRRGLAEGADAPADADADADAEKRKIEEKLRRELAEDDDDEPAPADDDEDVPDVPDIPEGHKSPSNRSLTNVSHAPPGRTSNAESAVLPAEKKK